MNTWECAGCGEDTHREYYMVHDVIWERYSAGDSMLCVGCLEDRMGRPLHSGDFTHWAINNVNMFEKSDRLIERLTSVNEDPTKR